MPVLDPKIVWVGGRGIRKSRPGGTLKTSTGSSGWVELDAAEISSKLNVGEPKINGASRDSRREVQNIHNFRLRGRRAQSMGRAL